MTEKFNIADLPKPQSAKSAMLFGFLVGFVIAGAAIVATASIAEAGYDFGRDLRAKHERDAAQNAP